MLVCLECNIQYEEGKTVCRFCGSPLTKKEESSSSNNNMNGTEEKPSEGKLTCPNCNITYEFGTSCIKCGLALVTENSRQSKGELKEAHPPEFEKKPSQEQTFQEPLPQASREKLFCPICKIIYERGESCVR